MYEVITIFVLFFIADYGLQPDGIVELKKTHNVVLLGHSFLVGFLPYLVGVPWWICTFLFMTHAMIDLMKIMGDFTVEQDQLGHFIQLVIAALMWRYAV